MNDRTQRARKIAQQLATLDRVTIEMHDTDSLRTLLRAIHRVQDDVYKTLSDRLDNRQGERQATVR